MFSFDIDRYTPMASTATSSLSRSSTESLLLSSGHRRRRGARRHPRKRQPPQHREDTADGEVEHQVGFQIQVVGVELEVVDDHQTAEVLQ